jgi:putative transcriptional regulator
MAFTSSVESGQLLLAEPFMVDPNFRRTAVLLCEHDNEGSLGLIINRPVGLKIADVVAEFPDFDAEVYYGGPVHGDSLHFIHNLGDLLEESLKVTDGVWWGGDFDSLKFLVSNELITPDRIRFFIGCAGWSGGQLDEEMEGGSWISVPMHPNYAFRSDPAEVWSLAMYNKGSQYEIIAEIPEYSAWN